MNNIANNEKADSQSESPKSEVNSPIKLTPLELNGIKLDAKHTVLSPDYLDKLIKGTSVTDK